MSAKICKTAGIGMWFPIAIIFLFAFALSTTADAKDLQAGVSPIVLDLGNLSKGTSIVGSFFIVTSSKDEILVKLDAQRSNIAYFKKPDYVGIADKVSEEDSSSWAFFPSNPYVLQHTNESLKTAGGSIADWKKVSFVLNVPSDAEPCNHALHIRPNPYVVEEYGTAVNIIALTAITIMFNIDGKCEVKGRILDILQNEETTDGTVEIDVYFQNTGTATVSARASSISAYYENGTKIGSLASGHTFVKPGKTTIMSAKFKPESFSLEGMYKVNATVDYGVNSTSKEATILIKHPKAITTPEPVAKIESLRSNYLVWLIILIIIIIAYKLYSKDEKDS
ncbi:hypothetical protein L6303_00035 [archaeon]|nr:hypothetical protein [Nanoarchaeota archaeon]MCG2723120.1 hypothetical protein [archaeon]